MLGLANSSCLRRRQWKGRRKSAPPARIVESLFRPSNQGVSESHFPQSDPASGQAVALGGQPLKRQTGMAGEEGDQCSAPPRGQELGGDRRGTRLHACRRPTEKPDCRCTAGELDSRSYASIPRIARARTSASPRGCDSSCARVARRGSGAFQSGACPCVWS